jgi:hypothetical protein
MDVPNSYQPLMNNSVDALGRLVMQLRSSCDEQGRVSDV